MPGRPAPRRPDKRPRGPLLPRRSPALALCLGLCLGFCLSLARPAAGGELRRSMVFMRPLLMGDAYAAMGDEPSTLFYNPAALATMPGGAVEAFTPQMIVDDILFSAILDPDELEEEYGDLTEDDFDDLVGTTLFTNINFRMPFVTSPEAGTAWGVGLDTLAFLEVLNSPLGPSLLVEYFTDLVLFRSYATRLTRRLAVGITPKLVGRLGINKVYTSGELFLGGETLSLENDAAFQDLQDGTVFWTPGVDLGLLYALPFAESWHPRVALTALNLGGWNEGDGSRGMEFGKRPNATAPPQAGELPQINTLGFAVSPTYHGVRYSLAVDFVDLDRRILPGDDLYLRTRVGLEIGIAIRQDGVPLLSLLFGSNATHGSFGVMSRVWIFEIGFGTYRVELGQKPGDNPDDRYGAVFGFRF